MRRPGTQVIIPTALHRYVYRNGRYRAPFGYRNVKELDEYGQIISDRRSIIEIEPWARPVLGRMRVLRLQGWTPQALGHKVAEEFPELPTPRKNTLRNKASVDAILKNPYYMGRFRYDGELWSGRYESVFTDAEWNELQASFGKKGNERIVTNGGLFSGTGLRLTCAECGCAICYDPKTKANGKTYRYYHCANGRGVHHRQRNVTEASILGQLSGAVAAIEITKDMADAIARALNETHRQAQRAKDREMDAFRADLVALDEKRNGLVDLRLGGEMDADMFRQQQARLQAERDELVNKLQEAQREIDGVYLLTAYKVLELAKDLLFRQI